MRYGILAAAMFVALLVAVVVVIELVRVPNIYAVEGKGEVKYTPDAAEISASIFTESSVSIDAAKQAAATMRNILAALKTAGVMADDIRAANVRSAPVEPDQSDPKTLRPAYFAEQTVVIQVHDLGTIGKILDAIARAGSNRWQVTFKVADRDRLERAARKAAFLDAIAVADAYALDGQFKRGRVLKIQDDAVAFPEVAYIDRDYRMRGRLPIWRPESYAEVITTGSQIATDTTFDVPPPKEETLLATTNVLFEIE